MSATVPQTRQVPRADHVGSLLRPAELKRVADEVGAHRAGHSERQLGLSDEALDRLRAAEDEAIAAAVQRQLDCGLDVVTDGEFRRELFTNSFYDAVGGLRPSDARRARSWKNTRGEEIRYPGPPVIEQRLSKADSPAAREVSYVAGITEAPIKATFPAGSWFVSPLARGAEGDVPGYDSRQELEEHALDILRELISDAIRAGARYIQLDFPSYVFLMDDSAKASLREGGVDTDALLERCLWADRSVLEGLPSDVRYGLHLCRGNYRSSWQFEGAIDPVAEAMFDLPYDAFLIEWDDTSREGDFSALRHVPRGPVVVIGAVSSKVNEMETEEHLLRRMDEATRHIGLEQLALSPQCGFASSRDGNLIDEEHQWRKLELIGRVADRLWPR